MLGAAFWLPGEIAAPAIVLALPTMAFDRVEFSALPEYSTSLPTGTAVGKRWRRSITIQEAVGVDWDGCVVYVRRRDWIVGRYEEDPDPSMVAIKWYRPIFG